MDGVMRMAGKPRAGVSVNAYRDISGFLKGPGAFSASTGEDGTFTMDMDPGRYFIVARMRKDGRSQGALKKGDGFLYFPANPVEVAPGERTKIGSDLLEVEGLDGAEEQEQGRTISGRVIFEDSKAARGYKVYIYQDVECIGRPLYSADVGGDGSFSLSVRPGTYWVKARLPEGKGREVTKGPIPAGAENISGLNLVIKGDR